MGQAQLGRIFDGDHALIGGNAVRQCVEGRRLAARGTAGDEHAPPCRYRVDEIADRRFRSGPRANEIVRIERTRAEPADREDRAGQRHRRDDRVHARPVGESRVDERIRQIDPAAERRDESFDEHEDLVSVAETDRDRLDAPTTLDPDAPHPVHHDLGHPFIAKQRRELAQAEEPVAQPSLVTGKLRRRQGNALRGGTLPEERAERLDPRAALLALAEPRRHRPLEPVSDRGHDASIASSSASVS